MVAVSPPSSLAMLRKLRYSETLLDAADKPSTRLDRRRQQHNLTSIHTEGQVENFAAGPERDIARQRPVWGNDTVAESA